MDCFSVKATVIILTYNQKRTIRRAIDSVLNQKCSYNYEILIADDGSEDGTREICEEYVKSHPDKIRIMPRVPNKGIVDNYFDAVMEARGEYVGDCAGDDEWLGVHRLQLQIEALDDDLSISAVCTDVEIYNVNLNTFIIKHGNSFNNESNIHIVSGQKILKGVLNHTNEMPFILSSALYRKNPICSILNNNPELLRCYDGGVEDVPVIAAIGTIGNVMHLPICGYRYNINRLSISNNLPFVKEYKFVAQISSLVRRLCIHYGVSRQEQKDFFKTKFIYMAAQIRHSGNDKLIIDLNQRLNEWGYSMPLRGKLHLCLFKIKWVIDKYLIK